MKLLVFVLFVSFCFVTTSSAESFTYDSSSLQGGDHIFTVSTNSQAELEITVLLSNRTDDTLCRGGSINSQSLSEKKGITRDFDFSRQGSPAVALYEWHLCFEIDNKTYKGWRGFDPGDNTQLVVDCKIDINKLGQINDLYLCKTRKVSVNEVNHNEYAQFCVRESCKSFETQVQYESFMRRDAKNVAAKFAYDRNNLKRANIRKRAPTSKEIDKIKKDAIEEIRNHCGRLRIQGQEACYEFLDIATKGLGRRTIWEPKINEVSVRKAFPILTDLKLVPSVIENFIPERKFYFAPHKVESNFVERYVVFCSSVPKKRNGDTYGCSLNIFQSFYLDDPNEYFDIDPMSNVTIALAALKHLKDFPVDTIDDKSARGWLNSHRVSGIIVENNIVTFAFRDSACSSQIKFRISEDLQEIKFVALEHGMCF